MKYDSTLMVDTIAAMFHSAMDQGATLRDVEDVIRIATGHLIEERKLLEKGTCSRCERKF